MDDTPASPASSTASDSDAYNTEDARLYFGPLKTPERNFVAASQGHLYPTAPKPVLRRSPRLSSPRSTPAIPTDMQTTDTDITDMECVAELVEVGEYDAMDSGSATPQIDYLPDEPSSALADRIMHALDNPSPPPSPPPLLNIFDPYNTTVADPSNDYQTDLLSLKISEEPEQEYEESHFGPSGTIAAAHLISTSATPMPNNAVETQEDLISFNSFSTPANTSQLGSTFHPKHLLSVDDLLSQSPIARNSASPQIQNDVRDVVMVPLESVTPPSHLLTPNQSGSAPFSDTSVSTVVVPEILVSALEEDDTQQQLPSYPPLTEVLATDTTPLRRSTRPRRSITPTLPLPPTPSPVLTAPHSPARTQVKKKALYLDFAENIGRSPATITEDSQQSPSLAMSSTTIRVRHRSPGKGPLSFQRELGSLSPTSANLLSGLGFTANESDNDHSNQPEASTSAQPMLSFSIFSPPADAAGPSTPIRLGPLRIPSPIKSTSSPNKFRIQTLAPNDPKNTPARRIPIAAAITQGHISPEKSIQMGLRPNGTPVASIPTPARRILVSDLSSCPPHKSTILRFGKPSKGESSGEPRQYTGPSDKGKGKEVQIRSEPSTSQTELPFPLLASIPAPIEVSLSSTGDIITKPKSSPLKSNLKHVTSRIPRIGAKPYSRSVDPKVAGDSIKSVTTGRVGGIKRPPKLIPAESVPSVRGATPVAGVTGGRPASRPIPTLSTSTTLLKRKREAEKGSAVKPRVIMLRQVPQVVITPKDSLPKPPNVLIASSAAEDKKAVSQAPTRIRRVMDPEPSTSAVLQHPRQDLNQLPGSFGVATAETVPVLEPSGFKEPLPLATHKDEISPGSPMKQDPSPPNVPELISDQQQPSNVMASALTPLIVLPEANITSGSSSTSDLRRTTRSRRNAITQDIFSDPPSRPSARRKAPAFLSDDIFSGMSMTALKDLTISNTVRNQRYFAAKLETEVVRREGVRPESPAVKVRTIVQKQQEEKDKQRAERANRRARRSGDMGSSDIEGFSDTGYSSPCEDTNMADGAEPLPRHQRGAGEDDDYETPERRHRHTKQTRLFDNVDNMEIEPKHRVKWDRGLFTAVYIDEVKLGSRETLKENRSLKGILAPTAKALRLDTLGNLPLADSPLVDLVQENIIVKKIVYDSDVPPISEAIVVKNTRSKNKKK